MEQLMSRAISLLVCFSLATMVTASDAPYVAPDADVRVVINAATLRSIMTSADGILWGGRWNKGGVICSSPDIHFELQGPDLWMRGWSNWVNANGALHALILGTPKVFTNDSGCGAIGLAAGCRIQGCVNDFVPGVMLLSGNCKSFGFDIWRDVIPLPSPLSLSQQLAFDLPAGPQKIDGGEINYEFGRFNGNTWETSFTPANKRIPMLTVPRPTGGRALAPNMCQVADDPRTCDDPICNMPKSTPHVEMRRELATMGFDLFLQPAAAQSVATEAAAEAKLQESDPLLANDFVGVSFSSRFLTGDQAGAGFFQRLLPVRVFGHKEVDSKVVEFQFFLTDARMQLGTMAGKDVVLASLGITQAEAWLKDDSSKRARIEKIGAEAAVTLPTFVVDPSDPTKAVLDMSVLQMAFGISTNIGSVKLCIESTNMATAFSHAIAPVARYLGPAKLFPDCIDADIPNFTAFQRCADGKQDKRMSLERPERNPTLALDVTHAKSRIHGGYWMISIPRP